MSAMLICARGKGYSLKGEKKARFEGPPSLRFLGLCL